MKVFRQLTGGDRDMLYVSVYCQPSGSPWYRMNASDCVINDVMYCCIELREKYGACNGICCGDFNGRTGDLQANDTFDFVHSLEDLLDDSDINISTRNSHDSELNDFGKRLLELCACFDLCVLNGFIDWDVEGNSAYVSDHGNSVVDTTIQNREKIV